MVVKKPKKVRKKMIKNLQLRVFLYLIYKFSLKKTFFFDQYLKEYLVINKDNIV